MREAIDVVDRSLWTANVQSWVADAGILDEEVERLVLSSFAAVPRTAFVDAQYSAQAIEDVDLPIGWGQWSTRPSLLVRVLGLINLHKRMRVLELGFGSGFLCAVMSYAGAQVFGIEQLALLAQKSRRLLDTLGHHGVVVRHGEGKRGWAESAPFNAIISSYSIFDERELPLEQLSATGVAVAPLVTDSGVRLALWRRKGDTFRRILLEEVEIL